MYFSLRTILNYYCFLFLFQRKSIVAVSFIAAFLCLIIVRLTNEVTFPLILNCFGQASVKWIPFSNGQRQPLRTHYGYINVKTQEVRLGIKRIANGTSRCLFPDPLVQKLKRAMFLFFLNDRWSFERFGQVCSGESRKLASKARLVKWEVVFTLAREFFRLVSDFQSF